MDLTDFVAISYAHEDISFNEKVIGFANCLREEHGYNCELPSRVTLADFQTTKKLANPHKY